MKQFTDSAGRTWTIAITIDSAKRVRDLLSVNLLELESGDPPLLTRLATDIILLCDVIYCIVKPQADKVGVTDAEFGAALGGDVILTAHTAFYEELVLFFRGLGRSDLAKAIEAQKRMVEAVVARIGARIDALDVDREIDAKLGSLSTSLPGS